MKVFSKASWRAILPHPIWRTGWHVHCISVLFIPFHYAAAAAAKSLQSCPTLSDPMDCSLPGSCIHGIFQARVLEWGAISFSSHIRLGATLISQFSHSVMSNSLRPHESQHAKPPCPSPTPGVHSDSRPSIKSVMPSSHSSSVIPFSSCLQSLPASESFPMSQLFT